VGVNDGTNLYTAYSGTNGNFYLRTAATINWAKAEVRIRNANGEKIMTGATPAAACNSCHTGTGTPRITAP
jgi:cytochrome c553